MFTYDQYTRTVEKNLSYYYKDLWDFKSDPAYNVILEHVSEDLGEEYLSLIKGEFSTVYDDNKKILIELAKENDRYGKPAKCSISDFTVCSPTNLRYIYHSLLILKAAKSWGKDAIDMIEIGGGYGGLCYYLHRLSDVFDVTIKSYSIFDIPTVCKLQKEYLRSFSIDIQAFGVDEFELNKDSFLVSNYAFSELPEDLRGDYTDRIISPFASCGFLAWNMIDVYDFVSNADIDIYEERPLTGNKNKFVYFLSKK